MAWKSSGSVGVVLNVDRKWTVTVQACFLWSICSNPCSVPWFSFFCANSPRCIIKSFIFHLSLVMGKEEEELAVSIAPRLGLQWQLGLECQCGASCFLKTTLCSNLAASRAAQRLHSLFIEKKFVFVFPYCDQTADRNGQCRKPACWEVFLGSVMLENVEKTRQKAVRRDLKNLVLRLLSWIAILSRREICAAEMMCRFSRCYE